MIQPKKGKDIMKPTISDTPYGSALDIRGSAIGTAAYFIKNPGVVFGDAEQEFLKAVRLHIKSTFSDIYQRVVEDNRLNLFTFADCAASHDQVPELLTLNDITVDGRYISKNIPTEYQNIWVNLSPILGKRDAYNSSMQVTDTPRLCALVSRGVMCASYNDSDGWLTPNLCVFIIETYSAMIGAHLRSLYNLTPDEYFLVTTLIAAYYAQLLGTNDSPLETPPLLYRCSFLGNGAQVAERLNVFRDERAKMNNGWKLSLDIVCKLLATNGPSRMKTVTSKQLYVTMSRGSIDSQAMLIALDYPPYWVYQLLANAQGSKNPNITNLIKFTDMKRKIIQFSNELVASKLFIDRINR